MRNHIIIEYVKDITVAKMANSNTSASEDGGKQVALFMQEVYDKLVELDKKDES